MKKREKKEKTYPKSKYPLINVIEDYLKTYAATNRNIRSYTDRYDDKEPMYIVSLDMGDFVWDIIYSPNVLGYVYDRNSNSTLRSVFRFSGDEWRYSVYDVFNTLDICDFSRYEYHYAEEKDKMLQNLSEMTGKIEEITPYITQIANDEALKTAIHKNLETDLETFGFDSESREEMTAEEMMNFFDCLLGFRFSVDLESYIEHLEQGNSAKAIKRLQKEEGKGELLLLEKRLLKALQDGRVNLPSKSDYRRSPKKRSGILYAAAFLISLIICFGLALVANVLGTMTAFDGSMPFTMFDWSFAAALAASIIFDIPIFKLMSKIIYKDKAAEYTSAQGLSKKSIKILGNLSYVAVVLAVAFAFYEGCCGIGLQEDKVVSMNLGQFQQQDKSYSDYEFYLCQGSSFGGEYSPSSVIWIKDKESGKLYQTDYSESEEPDEEQQKVLKLLANNSVEPISVKDEMQVPGVEEELEQE